MMRNQASDSAKTDKRKKNKIKCSGKTLLHFLFAKFGVVGIFKFIQFYSAPERGAVERSETEGSLHSNDV